MKKYLLMATALITAVSASAQFLRVQNDGMLVQKADKQSKSIVFKKAASNVAKVKSNAPTASNIYGDYLRVSIAYEDAVNTIQNFTISEASGSFETSEFFYETPFTFEYNIKIEDLIWTGSVLYGSYDAETGEIYVPVQTVEELSKANGYQEDYGWAYFTSLFKNEDGETYSGGEFFLTIDDDGNIELGEDILGYMCMVISDEGKSLGRFEDPAWDLRIMKPNGTMSYMTNANWLKDEVLSESYDPGKAKIYVEDWDNQLVVYGFFKYFSITIEMDEDGNCTIPFPQCVYNYEQEVTVKEGEEPVKLTDFYIYGSDENGQYPGLFETGVKGYIDGNFVHFYDLEAVDEQGNVVPDKYLGYIFLGFLPYVDEDGKSHFYGHGWSTFIDFEWSNGEDDPGEVTGIQNFNNTLEYKVKNTPTYNIMGQQVNRKDVKGLMIRDGKKYIAK